MDADRADVANRNGLTDSMVGANPVFEYSDIWHSTIDNVIDG